MDKIAELTPDQIAAMATVRDEWIAVGLDCRPANRNAAETAVIEMYRHGGHNPPARIVWCGSPITMALTRCAVLGLGASVRDSVGASVRDSVGASVRDSVWDSVGASVYGQHDAAWLSFYDFFGCYVGLREKVTPLDGLMALARSCGWALPHKNICWLSERTSEVHQDDRLRIHCETGPAIAYPDGWAIYAIHGVRVPAWIIETPKQITVAKIDAEQNAEVRRVMVNRYGIDRFIRDGNAKRLDHEEGVGTLYRRDVAGDEPIVTLEVINSTPEPDGSWKHYWLRVPPAVTKAREAAAWTFGMKSEEYRPAVET